MSSGRHGPMSRTTNEPGQTAILTAGYVATACVEWLKGGGRISSWAQLFRSAFFGLEPSEQRLALTFDDGPSEYNTPKLLDTLDKRGVKATFFLIGDKVRKHPQLVQEIILQGHIIGNHTMSHRNLMLLPYARVMEEIRTCEMLLNEITRQHPKLFRPPFGAHSPVVLQAANSLDLHVVMWSVTCFDWLGLSAQNVERIAKRQIRGGEVILLHDDAHGPSTVNRTASIGATERLIDSFQAKGYAFVTIPEMMRSTKQSLLVQEDGLMQTKEGMGVCH